MNEAQERIAALAVLEEAGLYAELHAQPQDVDAATAAILVHALELATPNKTNAQRAEQFFIHGVDDEEVWNEFVSGLSGSQKNRLFKGGEE